MAAGLQTISWEQCISIQFIIIVSLDLKELTRQSARVHVRACACARVFQSCAILHSLCIHEV